MIKRRNFSLNSGSSSLSSASLRSRAICSSSRAGIGWRQIRCRLVVADGLRDAKPLRQDVHQRCVDVVDTLAIARKRRVFGRVGVRFVHHRMPD